MRDNDIAGYALKKLKEFADDAVVSYDESVRAQVKFSDSRVSTTQRWLMSHIGIFASINRRTVSTSVAPDKASIDRGVKKLVGFARVLGKNEEYRGIAKGPFNYSDVKTFDKNIADVDMADLVGGAINAALENRAKRVAGIFETTVSKVFLLTTGGVEAQDASTQAYFSIRALCDNEGSGHGVSAARRIKDLNHIGAAVSSAETARTSMNPSTIDEGSYDILFEHLPCANILESAASSASIFNVESGLSCFIGELGKKVANANFTMVDDATLDWGINSRKFDDEGVPCQRTAIIDKGILKNYLHNTSTALKHSAKTTANAGIIAPRAINPVVEKGNLNKEEMIGKIKKGLLVTNVWYTRFHNYTTGDFSTIPRDGMFFIENGKIIKPVKGIRISDNLLRMLGNVAAASRDSRQVMSWEIESPITVPQMLVSGVNITKSVK